MPLHLDLDLNSKGFESVLTLDINTHGVTGIFGPSGCGKTSLLRAISGLDRHPNSTVKFGSELWQHAAAFVPTHLRGLAYVFQESSLFTHLTVSQNLDFAEQRAKIGGSKSTIAREEISALLNIDHLLVRDCNTLSGGESQRVAIARALCAQPRLLLMDEPLSALDSAHKAEIIPLLEDVCRRSLMPIVYVSHSIDEVARFADQLVLMDNGKVLGQGSTAEVLSSLDLPMAHLADAATILEGEVVKQELEFGLTHIKTPAGTLYATHAAHLALGERARLKLCARDLSITLEQPISTSILNMLRATVQDMSEQGDSQVLLSLDANGATLLARITKKSEHTLQLKMGQSLMVQVKSVALL